MASSHQYGNAPLWSLPIKKKIGHLLPVMPVVIIIVRTAATATFIAHKIAVIVNLLMY